MSCHRLLALLLGMILAGGWSALAWGQTILVTPSLTVSEEHDDNITLASKNTKSDFVTAIIPGLRLEITDHPWYVTFAGSVRGEVFTDHSDLNNFTDNWSGGGTVEYRPTPRFSVSLGDTYSRTVNPLDILRENRSVEPERGVPITGRFASTENTTTAATRYQITPLTLLGLRYSYSIFRSESPTALDSNTHEGGFSVGRRFTPQDTGTFRYTFNRFQVKGNPDQDSHDPRLGLTHDFSPTIHLTVEGGALFLERPDGSTEVTGAGTVRYAQEFSRGSLSVTYDRSASLAGNIGTAGVTQSLATSTNFVVARTLTLAMNSDVRETQSSDSRGDLRALTSALGVNYQPLRLLSMELQFSISDNRSSDRTVDFVAYSASVQARYQVFRWLSIVGAYRHEQQDDRVGPNDLRRNVFSLGLTASEPFRAR